MHQHLNITKRQYQVLEMIAYEYSNKEIARLLNLSVGTIESYRKILFDKLGAKNMAGLIRIAYETKLLVPTYISHPTTEERGNTLGSHATTR